MKEYDDIIVTGNIREIWVRQADGEMIQRLHPVVGLRGTVGAVSVKDGEPWRFKLWPEDPTDPQLPRDKDGKLDEWNNGKLWFNLEDTTYEMIEAD